MEKANASLGTGVRSDFRSDIGLVRKGWTAPNAEYVSSDVHLKSTSSSARCVEKPYTQRCRACQHLFVKCEEQKIAIVFVPEKG